MFEIALVTFFALLPISSMAASSDNILGYLAVSIGILAVVLVAWLAMRSCPLGLSIFRNYRP